MKARATLKVGTILFMLACGSGQAQETLLQADDSQETFGEMIDRGLSAPKRPYLGKSRSFSVPSSSDSRSVRYDKDAPPTVAVVPADVPTFSVPIQFAFDSAELDTDSHTVLAKVARALKERQHLDFSVMLIGHTDSTGSHTYNRDLGYRRAETVRENLNSLGVKLIMTVESKGETQPYDVHDTTAAINRRVEFLTY